MAKKEKKYILSNGIEIPAVGFGTDMTFMFIKKNIIKGMMVFLKDIFSNHGYYFKRDISIVKILKNLSVANCYLVDTASAYGKSEKVVGHMIKNKKIKDCFLVTKMSNTEQRTITVETAVNKSRKKLNVDCIDLYLLHWPQTGTYIDAWKELEKVYERGLVKAIGVSNFKPHHFEELKKHATIMPMVNQVECHPLFIQEDTYKYCTQHGIQMMAYTPTGRMHEKLKNNDILKEIALKYEKSIAQVIIRWHYQRGVIPIVNTTKVQHLKENMDIFDFELTEKDMNDISGINMDLRLRYDPDTVDFTKG